jgi:hypothetical protein
MIPKAQWQEAMDVQNACNLSGLVYSLPGVMDAICAEQDEEGYGTSERNTHPLLQLWLDKLCSLAGLTVEPGPVMEAYAIARSNGAH